MLPNNGTNTRLTNLEKDVGKLKETKQRNMNIMKKATNANNDTCSTNLEKDVGKVEGS